jgi:SAM-dependent methyltransferase
MRLILDDEIAVGDFGAVSRYCIDLNKEELSRRYVLQRPAPEEGRLRFLDVGGRDGRLSYLLGNIGPLEFDEDLYQHNAQRFHALYDYRGVDVNPAGETVLTGDMCDRAFLVRNARFAGTFDTVYSNNVFEHFERPWIAAEMILQLMKPGALCITIVPFAQRYHEDPGDYFRYTPAGIEKLFESAGPIRILEAGFDIRARRYDWQGGGTNNDIVPTDHFGAWRETWFTVVVIEKR